MEESSNCGKLTAQLRRAKVWLLSLLVSRVYKFYLCGRMLDQ